MSNDQVDDNKEPIEISSRNEIQAVSVKLPPFWVNSPSTWFIQAEAQFVLARVSSDTIKFHYILSALPQTAIDSVLDYIQNLPENDIYKGLKQKLIERHSLSEERRIEELLSNTELGDKKPSELYRHLNQLAGTSGTFGENLIKKLWLRRLSPVINVALIPLIKDGKDISQLAEIADKIFEVSSGFSVSLVNAPSTVKAVSVQNNKYEQLVNEISELKRVVHGLLNQGNSSSNQRSRSRSGSRFRSGSRNAKRDTNKYPLCWYHYKFGDKARKCDKPCNFNGNGTHTQPSSKNE